MTEQNIIDYLSFIQNLATGAQHQHDDRAAGKFGPERATAEQLAYWNGRVQGLQEAHDELKMRLEISRGYGLDL